jgi:multicomponent Na+:H+ antiporter subunit G
LVAWIFQLLTVPVSAHMVGRSGYRTKHLQKELLSTDELADVVERAGSLDSKAPGSTSSGSVPGRSTSAKPPYPN